MMARKRWMNNDSEAYDAGCTQSVCVFLVVFLESLSIVTPPNPLMI